MTKSKVLVLNAGRAPGLTFCKSLQAYSDRYELVGVERNPYSVHNAKVDRCLFIPPMEEEAYFEELQKVIKDQGMDLIYASKTNEELLLVSERRDELECKTFLPSKESVRLFEDKWQSYLALKKNGIPTPATVKIDTPQDIKEAISIFGEVWLRAVYGSGGNGSIPTSHVDLATAWVDNCDGWGRFTASEVLKGKTATWSAVWWNGELVAAQGRRRLYWEHSGLSPSGVSGVTGAQYTVADPIMDKLAMDAITSLDDNPHGIISVDFTYANEYEDPRVTEVQASRFYTSIDFLTATGLNFPQIYCALALGHEPELPRERLNPVEEGKLWIKYPETMPRLSSLAEIETMIKEGGVNV